MFLLGSSARIGREGADSGEAVSLVASASDLKTASECEWGFLRALDAKLGRAEALIEVEDPMNRRAAALGDEHEEHQLAEYRRRFERVVEVPRPARFDRAALRRAAEQTHEALRSGADVVFQATFFDESGADGPGSGGLGTGGLGTDGASTDASGVGQGGTVGIDFVGFADFLVRRPDGSYRVQDTKLARSPRVTALLQVAAYARQIRALGIAVDPEAELLLGDGRVSRHRLGDIEPVFDRRWRRFVAIAAERRAAAEPLEWGDERYAACCVCAACRPEVERHRDVALVAGLRLTQRARLAAAGIHSIDELAESSSAVADLPQSTLDGLRSQARLQRAALDAEPGAAPAYELVGFGAGLAALPEPDAGDIFFDFEGDPLYTEDATIAGSTPRWGLDYLFGLVDAEERFTAFWAHSFAEERQALIDFVTFVHERRERHPDMHVYHYAPYERSHLASLATRHGVCEAEVDDLLRDHVLVDLYAIVRQSLLVGSPSYSIKKLEPLYMGDEHRDQTGVTKGDDSVAEYARAQALRAAGDDAGWREVLEAIADYNTYDCVSTLRLRDWLLDLADESGVAAAGVADRAVEGDERELKPEQAARREQIEQLVATLQSFAGEAGTADRTADEQAYALAAAAVEFHWRESKIFWWEHYARLGAPMAEWADTRGVFAVTDGEVVESWHLPTPRSKILRRRLRLHGRWAPGSGPSTSDKPFAVYEAPGPFTVPGGQAQDRPCSKTEVADLADDATWVEVVEKLPKTAAEYAVLPAALTPGVPPRADSLADAIFDWGLALADAHPEWPQDAAASILRRVPPRLPGASLRELVGQADPERRAAAVTKAVLGLDHSYLAVQGPPGTGKTFVGAQVIATLVRDHGYTVGVVGQSHKTSENLLAAVVRAGVDPTRVGKRAKSGETLHDVPFTVIPTGGDGAFVEDHPDGCVIGGTAWTFANANQLPRRSLDLLVIDEAGQYSLAATIAAGVSAQNLLLLGDPQQLPQVSQAAHPEPIDTSALGWLSDGHDVLPAEYGFFLAESRRMHPAVTAPVSYLSYEGLLYSHPWGSDRRLDGVEAGLHPVAVDHVGDATESIDEAERVRELVQGVLGRAWTDPHHRPSRKAEPLTQYDVIVVTPYNAQLECVRRVLDAAGLDAVRVGTVDKFQGQEAPVAIVSLAASSAAEVPRGMEFLIMPNRLNVAISRAQWAAYLVYSPALLDHLPTTPTDVARLSAFITLVDPGGAAPR